MAPTGRFRPRPRQTPSRARDAEGLGASKNPGLGGGTAAHLNPYTNPVHGSPKPLKAKEFESEWDRIERQAGLKERTRYYPRRQSDDLGGDDAASSGCSSAVSGHYKSPTSAGVPRGIEVLWDPHNTSEKHGPPGHVHDRLADGFTRRPPKESETLRKAVPGYGGYIPGWQTTQRGIGKTFHARREVCLKNSTHACGVKLSDMQRVDPRVEKSGSVGSLPKKRHGSESSSAPRWGNTQVWATPWGLGDGTHGQQVNGYLAQLEHIETSRR